MSDEPEGWPIKVTRATVKLWWLHFFVIGLNFALLAWVLVIVLGLAASVEKSTSSWANKEAELDRLIQKLNTIQESHPWTPPN